MMEQNHALPKFIQRLLARMTVYEDLFVITGDIEDQYSAIRRTKGKIRAYTWLFWNTLQVAFYYCLLSSRWRPVMFRNYLKIARRDIIKFKVYSAINILGMAVGFTFFLLISLFIQDELSYDKFFENKDSIYRLVRIRNHPDGNPSGRVSSLFPMVMEKDLREYFPEFEYMTRFKSHRGVVRSRDHMFRENLAMADAQFFQIFSFTMISGNQETSLSQDDSVVLTRSYAEKYFGENNPLGKSLTITFGDSVKDYTVTGVVEDIPHNSSIRFNILMNLSNYGIWDPPERRSIYSHRGNFNMDYFVRLRAGAETQTRAKFLSFYRQNFDWYTENVRWEGKGDPFSIRLQKLLDIHMDSAVSGGSNPATSFILAGIAFLVLVIACINFMNLSTGTSIIRSPEIGMRKVLGAGKKNLICQFWLESLLICGLALTAGIFLTIAALPHFNALAGKHLRLVDLLTLNCILPTAAVLVFSGIISGSYPALVMANFKLTDILRGKLRFSRRKIFSRAFVVIQFALSVFLIITAFLLGAQLKYMLSRDIGYDRDGLLAINILENTQEKQTRIIKLFKEKAGQNPQVLGVTASTTDFSRTAGVWTGFDKDGRQIDFMDCVVDFDFVKTLGLKIAEGRDYSREFSTESEGALVNRPFIRALGMASPVGKTIGNPNNGFPENLRIIGVVEDFNFQSLHYEIDPAVFHLGPGFLGTPYMLVRIATIRTAETIAFLEQSWKEIQPNKPFIFSFLSETIEGYYSGEKQWSLIVEYSSGVAVLIACMGIFGLTALMINRRIKEIGIRKVLGAKISQVVNLVLKDFVALVFVANLLAWPVVYYVGRRILMDYPFRIEFGISYFVLALAVSISPAVLISLYQALRAALANPAESIRNE